MAAARSLYLISVIWGVHLTGVGGWPPRAARRGSLQDEAARPSQPFQVVCISREPSLKLPKRLRVVGAGMWTFHCPSLRSTPVKWIPQSSEIIGATGAVFGKLGRASGQ